MLGLLIVIFNDPGMRSTSTTHRLFVKFIAEDSNR